MANQVALLLHLPKELEAEARRYRKLLGGGWRQAGVLAAAGILALEEGPKHLRRDHEMARALAEGLFAWGSPWTWGRWRPTWSTWRWRTPRAFSRV